MIIELPRNFVPGDLSRLWTTCPWNGPSAATPQPEQAATPPHDAQTTETTEALFRRLATALLRSVSPFPDAYQAICTMLASEFPLPKIDSTLFGTPRPV